MAEAFFNQLAKGKVKALSAGTDPADAIDPTVVEAMREVGLDISGNKPKALSPEMTEQAETVVTMGCGVEGVCPETFVETEDWALEDPRGKPLGKVREIRDEIKVRVMKMLEEAEA
jgi:protein-tyrosine-phosphatase